MPILLSKKDPAFISAVSISRPIEWLNGKKNPPHRYYFRTIATVSLPKGSKLLFSFENLIFGEAIIKTGNSDFTEIRYENTI